MRVIYECESYTLNFGLREFYLYLYRRILRIFLIETHSQSKRISKNE